MSESKSHRLRAFFGSPVALLRLSSILFFGLMVGHVSAYPWTSIHVPQDTQLVGSMKAIDFVFFGEHTTYWNLYFGFGILIGVLLLAFATMLWLLSDLARVAPRRLGMITGFISAICLVGAYLCFRFFFTPPVLLYLVICGIMLVASVQLLRPQTLGSMQNG
jgi:hypothetical protein